MNLREEYYPWKNLIGEVILDVKITLLLIDHCIYIEELYLNIIVEKQEYHDSC